MLNGCFVDVEWRFNGWCRSVTILSPSNPSPQAGPKPLRSLHRPPVHPGHPWSATSGSKAARVAPSRNGDFKKLGVKWLQDNFRWLKPPESWIWKKAGTIRKPCFNHLKVGVQWTKIGGEDDRKIGILRWETKNIVLTNKKVATWYKYKYRPKKTMSRMPNGSMLHYCNPQLVRVTSFPFIRITVYWVGGFNPQKLMVNPQKSRFYHGFTMVYHGFTMVLPWFTMVYHGFTMVFLHGFMAQKPQMVTVLPRHHQGPPDLSDFSIPVMGWWKTTGKSECNSLSTKGTYYIYI